MTKRLIFSFLLLGMTLSSHVQATVLDFEEFAPGTYFPSPVITKGVQFTGNFVVNDYFISGVGNYDQGSTGLIPFGLETHTMSLVSGLPFNLLSWDMGSFTDSVLSLTVQGMFDGGGSISQILTTDALNGYENFVFSNFTALSSVVFTVGSDSPILDNINIEVVPEPTTLALMGLGLAGISWKRRKAA